MPIMERKLKLLLITDQHFFPSREGLSTVMTELTKHLPAERLVCVTGLKTAHFHGEINRSVSVTTLFDEGSKWGKVIELIRLVLSLKLRLNPDIIIVDSCWSGNIALMLGKLLRVPTVMLAHGNEILQLRDKTWQKQYLSLANAAKIVAISNYTKNLLMDAGLPEEQISVLHLGADPEVFYPMTGEEAEKIKEELGLKDKLVLMTVGNLFLRKGQDMVIKALHGVLEKFPNLIYLLVGEGRDENYLRELTVSLGLENNVRFIGVIEDWNNLRELYNVCDIYIMTSRLQKKEGSVENFGIAFVEANACGKPVIGGRSGGVPEAIIDGETGILVDPENVEDVQEAIINLLENPGLAAKLGQNGLRRIENDLNWKRVGERLESICLEVLNS